MEQCIEAWNTYADYEFNIPVYYDSGIPTAQANYLGSIGFGGQGSYRTAMHESSHWLGTGAVWQWNIHYRYGMWNGTYAYNLRCAYDGPGERQFGDGWHYWPDGANYESEGVNAPHMVGLIGAFRRDMELPQGDRTIGIATGTYRLRQRMAVLTLDSRGAFTEGALVRQTGTSPNDSGQLWNVSRVNGSRYFTLQNVANGLYLDSLGSSTNGDPVGMTAINGEPADSQLWEIILTDSFFFKITNKANGKALDNLGLTGDGDGVGQWDAAGNLSWNQHWTFLHPLAQLAPLPGVVSQGMPVRSSSTDANHYDWKGNNGVSGDRWTASSGSYPQWWRVDTGIVQPITRVEIDWFSQGSPVFQYRIEVSDDDVLWTTVADRTGNSTSGTTVDVLDGVSGRYVRVIVTGATPGYWAAFMECRVYNEAEFLQNLSQHHPTWASSVQAGNLAVNANDVDSLLTRWCSGSPGYPAWWQVDLGSARPVNRIVINWFDDDGRSFKYRIEGSIDGVTFTTLADRTGNTTPTTTADNFSAVTRFVRVTVTGGSADWPSFYDAQVFGVLTPAEAWRLQHFGSTSNSGSAADSADPDGDGVENLLERAFGGDPNLPESDLLPSIDKSAPMLSIRYRKALEAGDLAFLVQESASPAGPWIPAEGSESILSSDGTIQDVSFTRLRGSSEPLFLRLLVGYP